MLRLQVLVLCVYQLINLALSLCPNATTYSGLLNDSLGPRWAKAYDIWIALTIFGTSKDAHDPRIAQTQMFYAMSCVAHCADVVLVCGCLAAIAWNVVIAGTLAQLLVDLEWLRGEVAGPWTSNRQFFVLVTSSCVLVPLVSIPTFHKLRYISSLSVGAMLFVTFVVVLRVSAVVAVVMKCIRQIVC